MARKTRNRNRRRNSGHRRKYYQDSGANSKPPENDLTKAPVEPAPVLIDKKELGGRLGESKARPIHERVLQEKRQGYKELIMSELWRVALIVNGILQGFDETDGNRMVAIFKGKVQNLEPGLKAAFVDIGQEKNAFLHYWDMLPGANNDPSIEIVRENKKKSSAKHEVKSIKDIPKAFPIGSEIIVQITKAQIGSKGPRTTTNLSLPGRFCSCPMPSMWYIQKNRRQGRTTRLKRIIGNLSLREGMGVIIRTAIRIKLRNSLIAI